MRVVLDTNVLVSAFAFPGGAPESMYRLALEGRIELVTCVPLLVELGRVLAEKLGREPRAAEEAVAQVAGIGVVVEATEEVDVIAADPADNRVLETALAGEAQAIVSGDRHLLRLKSFRGIRICSPAEYLAGRSEDEES